MITVTLCDQTIHIQDNLSLEAVLMNHGHTERDFAVTVNSTVITRANYSKTFLNAGDVVDIILPMQGG